ncbi:Tat pathway signal protein [Oceanobacillus picturae]|uniref:Tat pathway signal protein n=1 Tax=Oceanobacillus picturae TaxID=171693 RepID=A0A0U9H668_9BACI|nr:hypothetical protein [Oceanobacillus picturae]GAQ17883.1 Tat pathway signal protein [Oceanobacillus picturae]
MKQTNNYLKVMKDMFTVQMMWAFGVMGVMLIIGIVRLVLQFQENGQDNFYNSFFVVATFFFFVIGIMATYFLPHYVGHGVTRKDYYKGASLALIGMAITLPFIVWGISVLTEFVVENVTSFSFKEPNMDVSTEDSNFIGDIVEFLIVTPFVEPDSNWVLAIGIFSLKILTYYLAGWLISAAFYKFSVIAGLGFIAMSIVLLTVENVLLRSILSLPIPNRFAFLEMPEGIAIAALLLIPLGMFCLIRVMTKRVSVKM